MLDAIRLENISKAYKDTKAVKDLEMKVPQGVVYGMLGRNGAGKTTTIRIIMGLVRPDTGRVYVLGKDAAREREFALSNLGAIVESPGLYSNLSAEANLAITADLFRADKKRIEEVLKITGLSQVRSKKVKKFSYGMRQRLGIANALIHSPKILILDEPTNGLDPEGVTQLRNLIKNLSRDLNITVIMSSHILSEVQQVADYVGIIDKGTLCEQFAIGELSDTGQKHLLLEVDDPRKAAAVLNEIKVDYTISGKEIKVYCKKNRNGEINNLITAKGIIISNMSSVRNSLEDRFLSVINRE